MNKKRGGVLKEKGIVATPQRIAVWNFLRDNREHPCVERVFGHIRKQFPTISLATVYSILETFKNSNLVLELSIRKNKTCFDPVIEQHHHLLCRICDKIYDVDIKCANTINCEICGHKVESVHGYFYGVCCICEKKGGDLR